MREEANRQVAVLKEEGFVIVNPLEALIQADQRERMYYFLDTHLTKTGNKVVAGELTPVLQDFIH
jgi:hypothetical protein